MSNRNFIKTEEELRRDLKDYSRNESRSAWLIVAALLIEAVVVWKYSTDKSLLETVFLIISDLTIAAGVYGEIYFGRKASIASTALQQISDEKIAAANERAAQLALDLDRERAARSPRVINPEQRKLLVELLSPDSIIKGAVIINPAMDGEAWQFADSLLSVLEEVGFKPSMVPFNQRAVAFNKPGAFIWIKDVKNQPKHAGPLFEAFKRANILFVAEEHPKDEDVLDVNTVVIAVSAHP